MELVVLSFIAGVLTVLAPCILPLLPVIVGGSLTDNQIIRPIIITLSLAGSIVFFTLILKVSTALITIPQAFWTYFSGGIILLFAFTLLFPMTWAKFLHTIGLNSFEQKSNQNLYQQSKKSSYIGMVATGAALGPVFASCSPTYFYVLGTVLPGSWSLGMINLVAYSLGLAGVMFVVAFAGQRALSGLQGLSDPQGWFKKSLGILFLLVGVAIISGYDKKIEAYILDAGYFDVTKVEQQLLDKQIDEMEEKMEQEKSSQEIQSGSQPIPVPESSFDFPLNKDPGELLGTGQWYNSKPIESLESLRGKVVAVKFWTYSCINCIRTFDETSELWDRFKDQDFVLLGVHTPEFAFEHDPQNLENEIDRYGLEFPIVQDNDYKTWRSFNNRYWPAFYLIDRQGKIRYTHFGEGRYQEKQDAVEALLALP